MSIISSFWRLPSSGKLFMAEMEKSSCLVAMGAFLCLLGASQNASAANYFNWGAESDNTSRGPILSYAGQTTRDCTVAHSGSCSMRLNVIGNDGGNQQMGAEPGNFTYPDPAFVGSRAIYYRWWMKIMVGFSWGAFDQKTKSDRVQGNGVPGGYTGYLNSTSFELGEAV